MADTPRLEEAVEFAENPEPRCPCVLLLDTPGSMQGNPIAALNEGLKAFDLVAISVLLLAVGLWGCQRTIVSLPAPAPATTSPGQIQGRDGAERVPVPSGEFLMGSPAGEGDDDERPQHRVHLDAFYLDKVEVTNARYRKCVEAGKCTPPGDRPGYDDSQRSNHPVVYVDWGQARAYCGWAGGRLPTEAEWEKAARGPSTGSGDGRVYPWGSDFGSGHANIYGSEDGYEGTAPMGSFPSGASPYGALDMAGNVWEWVADWYDEGYYNRSPSRNPREPDRGEYRVLRGGSWSDVQDGARAADRNGGVPGYWIDFIGFRCAQGLQ